MYRDRFVTFIDILGFKDIILKSEKDPNIAKALFEALNNVTGKEAKGNALVNINDEKKSKKDEKKLLILKNEIIKLLSEDFDLKVTHFSDCLVFSAPVENEIACFTILEAIAKLMIEMHSKYQLLIRGGVSINKLCHEENGPLFGPALVEAYELESKKAIYPRILFSKNVALAITKTEHHKFMDNLFKTTDDEMFFSLATAYDYIYHSSSVLNKDNLPEKYHKSLKDIELKKTTIQDDNIKKKYCWIYDEMQQLAHKF